MQLRVDGYAAAAKIVDMLGNDPGIGEQILRIYEKYEACTPAQKLTGEEAVGLIVHADLSKLATPRIREIAKKHNADIFPCYDIVLAAKNQCTPPSIAVTETCAEVPVQSLVDHNACRLVRQLELSNTSLFDNFEGSVELELEHKWDGKARAALTDTHTANCSVCGATASQMKYGHPQHLKVNVNNFKYGISVLHARIRFLEPILHLSYKLHLEKHRANKALYEEEKGKVQSKVKKLIGISVDVVKQGVGTTNSGNASRRFFENPSLASSATGVDVDIIERINEAVPYQDNLHFRLFYFLQYFWSEIMDVLDSIFFSSLQFIFPSHEEIDANM
ncbi:UDP-N-acetylglucosamine--N-acetylmuramyl-(pentapeptide) pyrophosphoryl-undecaprenol N-acetylglucosamine transferase, partial [Frankliniella fusca]